ncbi:branched-chain amino acid ABC transporter permease [Rhizobium sp. C1]|uniref:branched-chain amino acid ABC transporter permease n=1 Tax=Rhizobium sp. C1 TaxID=1349799 RepID=UPI001E3EA2EE|nr:branched-chain amino acid ABC transporter permease [Rhizobium sp. C1]MCD2177677.1 branched-chain amino acid ABC transporter permease [Rhizobium sp. C1]
MAYILQQAVNSVPVAALYALLAFAYSLAFAVTRRADITIGALFAFSGQIFALFFYIAWQRYWLILELCIVIGAAAAFLYTTLAATVVGRYVLQPLTRSEPHAVIVGGFAVMIVLMETARLASQTRSIWLPPLLKTPVTLLSIDGYAVTLTQMQLVNVAVMLCALALLAVLLARAAWGRRWKAVRDDPLAAELLGVDSRSVFIQAYVGAALIATFAGLLMTAYYGTMDFGAGLMFGLKVIMLGALGGYASPLKSAAGGAILGLSETMWTAFGPLALRDIVIFSALVYILVMTRPEQQNAELNS